MNEIEKSITETIKTSNLSELTIDYAEVFTDSVLKDGILKDIPIVNSIVGVGKIGFAINDYLFLKKILSFLVNIKDVHQSQREKLLLKIENSEKYQKNVGEAILLIINKMDDLEKPKIIGKIFSFFLNEEIDYETFLRLSQSIEKVFLPYIDKLIQLNSGQKVDYEIQNQLFNSGLLSQTRTGDLRIGGGNEYYVNQYGIKLIEILKK